MNRGAHVSLVRARHLAATVVLAMLAALLGVAVTGAPSRAAEAPVLIPSDAETVPSTHTGDSIDDPAIWVNHASPAQSLVIANDKLGALETYNLDGSLAQRIAPDTTAWGNVDVRQDVTIGAYSGDLVAVPHQGVRFYSVDHSTRQLAPINDSVLAQGLGEGLCLYQSPTTRKVYGFSITIQGVVTQYEIQDTDGDGLLETHVVRSWAMGSESEGCVADDRTGSVYISQEDVALWRFDAEPDAGTVGEQVDVRTVDGGHLVSDIEGVTLVDQANGDGYIIASAQNVDDPNNSYFSVYRRGAGNDFVNTFRVSDGTSSDDCDRTDGVAAVTGDLGPAFPQGMFVCQDNNNDPPGSSGNQDLKMVRLEKVVNLDGGPPPPPPPPPPVSPISFVGQSTANANAASFTVQVPASVQQGDALVVFASHLNTASLTGPGAGWSQVGTTVVDNSIATTMWRKTAESADAGSLVRFAYAGGVTKVAATLAAYRGVDATDPIATVAGAGEPGTSAAHTTPVVPNTTPGAWRVSYWSDKNAATTRWTAPDGETTRATSAGSGSGRMSALLTDPGSAQTAGSPASTGGLVATADAASNAATMWTVLLRPAGEAPPPPNQPPVARFTSTCLDLTCSFDASTSSDAEDSLSAYAWDFGDGTAGTQVTEDHQYAGPGTYDVSLTVTDASGATDTTSHTVTVGTAPPHAIDFVGTATSDTNSTSFSVRVPAVVTSGDALLLFVSQSSTTPALTGPGAGWTQIGQLADGELTTVWRRVATASDAGSVVRFSSGSSYVKVALTLVAYRGTDTTDPVASISGAREPGSSALHTTPSVPNATSGAWRLSYWSDKTSATTAWSAPAGEQTRATTVGSGGGRVSGLLTDSGAPLSAGAPATTGGLSAQADAPSSAATMWTVLLRPGG